MGLFTYVNIRRRGLLLRTVCLFSFVFFLCFWFKSDDTIAVEDPQRRMLISNNKIEDFLRNEINENPVEKKFEQKNQLPEPLQINKLPESQDPKVLAALAAIREDDARIVKGEAFFLSSIDT